MSRLDVEGPSRQRFRSLSTTLPDLDGNKCFNLPFNVFSSYDPVDEESDVEENSDVIITENKYQEKSEPETPIQKLRRTVKSIIFQNRWTKLISTKLADEECMKKLKEMDYNSNTHPDILTFNPGAFSSSSNSQQTLTTTAKRLLSKPSWKRSDEDLRYIFKTIDNLMIMKKYPPLVKQELAKSLQYECFQDGRIIIQQGHVGFSLYFVIKGSVAVEVATIDKDTGQVFKQIVNEITAGGSFGEMALMSGLARAATVICIGNSEFLRIDKEDFQEVLMRSYHKEIEKKTNFLKKCPIFHGWMLKELRAASTTTDITEYLHNKVITQDLSAHSGTIYIIMSGTCLAVSKIKVLKESLPYGKVRMKMLSNDDDKIKSTRYQKKEDLFLVTRKLGYMDCFGFGEVLLENTSIISHDKVEILAVPTVHLLRHSRGHCLDELRKTEMKKYPTLKEAFNNFLNQQNWKNYKDDLRQQVLNNKSQRIKQFRTITSSCRNVTPSSKQRTVPLIRQVTSLKKDEHIQLRTISPAIRKRRISTKLKYS